MTSVEKRFKKRMLDRDVKQIDIARRFGWSATYVKQLISGATLGPAAETNLQKVKDFLEMK